MKSGRRYFKETGPGRRDLHQRVKTERGEQVGATAAFNKALDDEHKKYMEYLVIARVATHGMIKVRSSLRLDDASKTTFGGWMGQAQHFYIAGTADPDFMASMAKYGITLEMLDAGKVALENIIALKKEQAREAGEAQHITKLRDDAMETLHRWVMDMIAIARIALADTPQLLEKLNIIVTS